MQSQLPNVIVLMATWNGARWISEQFESIFSQLHCNVHIVVSDDHSSDQTLSIITKISPNEKLSVIDPPSERLGSANKNFIHLILLADVDSAKYISFSDQDDIWDEDKLHRAIESIEKFELDGYSSNVVAFWEDGRSALVDKSGTQKKFDYLFESGGPGCTFVIKKERFLELRDWVKDNLDDLRQFVVHDWLIYAFARSHGWKWYIDEVPSMRYRQHSSNEFGANIGIRAKRRRFLKFLKSDYLKNSLVIGELTARESPVVAALREFSFLDVLYLVVNANQYRRHYSEVWALRFLILTYWLYKGLKYHAK